MSIGPYILLLPDVALEKIFSFLSYNEIAKNREVCKKFDEICGKLLSRGFIQIEKRHSTIFKRMKTMLPRRESERRTHPLARHCDILSAVETRISMLNMTFSRYMESGLCCFIPGKVIDEIENVLKIVELLIPPPRTHELLQELRDISSMAMEHFEEFILPGLKAQIEQPSAIPILPSTTSKNNKFVLVQCSLADDVKRVKKQNKVYKAQISQIFAQIEKLNRRGKRQYLKLKAHSVKIREQERKLQEQSVKILEQETTITDLRKHIDEWEQKFSDLTAEVRARDEFIEKPTCTTGRDSTLPHKIRISQNIMPRKAQPLPRSLTPIGEIERKRKCSLPLDPPTKLARRDCIKEEHAIPPSIKISNIVKDVPKPPSSYPKPSVVDDTMKIKESNNDLPLRKPEVESFWNSAIETLIKNPITCIKSRKRKMQEDIDVNTHGSFFIKN